MGKKAIIVIFGLVMVAIIVSVDILFFRHKLSQRLIANIAIVLVFAVFYLIFLRRK